LLEEKINRQREMARAALDVQEKERTGVGKRASRQREPDIDQRQAPVGVHGPKPGQGKDKTQWHQAGQHGILKDVSNR
jgi:hypothetical protein